MTVKGKKWEAIAIVGDVEDVRCVVQVRLVGGSMKKRFPLAQVQQAMKNG